MFIPVNIVPYFYYIGMGICVLLVFAILIFIGLCIKDNDREFITSVASVVFRLSIGLLCLVSVYVIAVYNLFIAIGFAVIGCILLTISYLVFQLLGININIVGAL